MLALWDWGTFVWKKLYDVIECTVEIDAKFLESLDVHFDYSVVAELCCISTGVSHFFELGMWKTDAS